LTAAFFAEFACAFVCNALMFAVFAAIRFAFALSFALFADPRARNVAMPASTNARPPMIHVNRICLRKPSWRSAASTAAVSADS
jgi:hypothetical protein